MFVCLFGCLFVCIYVPYSRPNGCADRDETWHALMSTQGVFLARSMSRSFTYACETDSNTKHPALCANTPPSERRSGGVRTPAAAPSSERNYNATNKTRRRRCRAANGAAAIVLRPEDGWLELVFNNTVSTCATNKALKLPLRLKVQWTAEERYMLIDQRLQSADDMIYGRFCHFSSPPPDISPPILDDSPRMVRHQDTSPPRLTHVRAKTILVMCTPETVWNRAPL